MSTVKIEVWGNYACFTRPEFKAERVSYECPTPSAIRGLVESIYWHPGVRYVVKRIHVLNPIKFDNVRRNELGAVTNCSGMWVAAKQGRENFLYASECIQQRNTMLLRDVHYVVELEIRMTENANDGDTLEKYEAILRKRIRKGRCFAQPYFGCREFPAFYREWEDGKEIPAISVTKDLGMMLYDLDFTVRNDIRPQFFRARLEQGVLDLTGLEVCMT